MKKLIVLMLASLFWVSLPSVYGQACFKAYDVQTGQEITAFCVGQQVRFKSCNPDSQPDLEYYDFDKSNTVQFPDTVKFHTYSTPGSYTVTQLINTGAKGVHQGERTFSVLPAPKPSFKVTSCSQRFAQVTITDENYDSFVVNFGGGVTRILARGGTATHQFAAGQPMNVVVTGHYDNALCSEAESATVQELPMPPQPRLARVQVQLPVADGHISFNLEQLQAQYHYVIERQSGAGFAPIDTIKNPATSQITRQLTRIDAAGPACFRIRATDPCGNAALPVSNTVCSLPVSISAAEQITLSWFAYPDAGQLTGYQLYKDGQLYRDLPKEQRSFADESVTCGQQYCYELIANLANGSQSVSNNPCTSVSTSAAPAQPYLSSSFTPENRIHIAMQVPVSQGISQVSFRKSVGGGAFSDLPPGTALAFEDNTFNQDQVYCYQVLYRDPCGQTSPLSNTTCPIVLKADRQPDNTVLLGWSAYVGFPAGPVAYLVEQVDASGTVLSGIPVSGNRYTVAPGNAASQQQYYRVRAHQAGQPDTYSNTVTLTFDANAQIPNAFTPNGDKLNDVFEVKGRFIQLTGLTIYDRWGQIIYQSQGQGWDGRINGKQAPTGTYPYLVTWKDHKGLTWKKTGLVNLLR